MIGELVDDFFQSIGKTFFEALRQSQMQAFPIRAQQVLINRVAHQRVLEAKAGLSGFRENQILLLQDIEPGCNLAVESGNSLESRI